MLLWLGDANVPMHLRSFHFQLSSLSILRSYRSSGNFLLPTIYRVYALPLDARDFSLWVRRNASFSIKKTATISGGRVVLTAKHFMHSSHASEEKRFHHGLDCQETSSGSL